MLKVESFCPGSCLIKTGAHLRRVMLLAEEKYNEIVPLLVKYFVYNKDIIKFLYTPSHLFGRFTPISLILSNDDCVYNWLKLQIELRDGKNKFKK